MKNLKAIRSQAMSIAHKLVKVLGDFGKAQKLAWKLVKAKLGWLVPISFKSKSNPHRQAVMRAIGSLDTISKGFIRFVEIHNGEEQWRSFKINNVNF